jgi:hypothetical protein
MSVSPKDGPLNTTPGQTTKALDRSGLFGSAYKPVVTPPESGSSEQDWTVPGECPPPQS